MSALTKVMLASAMLLVAGVCLLGVAATAVHSNYGGLVGYAVLSAAALFLLVLIVRSEGPC